MRYIGSKYRVLDFIRETVEATYGNVAGATVADLFSGTVCVAQMFKGLNARLITNDYLYFSYALQVEKIKLNKPPISYERYCQLVFDLNSLAGKDGFFSSNYTIEGSADRGYQRNYFSVENARKIDAICLQLKAWMGEGSIPEDMYWLLVANLVDAITKVSNTSGTYGAFLKIDDERKFKPIALVASSFADNGQVNECHCADIFDLVDDVAGDILYLDPPYNSRQYPPYYHILETAALYDQPQIYGITGRRPYQDKLSPLCMKDKALPALVDIVKRAGFNHVYISYSTDGIIPHEELCEELQEFGEVQCFFKPYRRYKSNDGGGFNDKLKEMIIYVKKG